MSNYRINSLKKENEQAHSEIRRQKRHKIIAIITGSLATVGVGYLWISK
jgi:hypothetical protein